jgi:hypothetical protein
VVGAICDGQRLTAEFVGVVIALTRQETSDILVLRLSLWVWQSTTLPFCTLVGPVTGR